MWSTGSKKVKPQSDYNVLCMCNIIEMAYYNVEQVAVDEQNSVKNNYHDFSNLFLTIWEVVLDNAASIRIILRSVSICGWISWMNNLCTNTVQTVSHRHLLAHDALYNTYKCQDAIICELYITQNRNKF